MSAGMRLSVWLIGAEQRRRDKEARITGEPVPSESSRCGCGSGCVARMDALTRSSACVCCSAGSESDDSREWDEYEEIVLGGAEGADEGGGRLPISEEERKLIREVATFFSQVLMHSIAVWRARRCMRDVTAAHA